MSKWNCRKSELFIPDKDTPQTYACKVCGSKIVPRKANRYTVVDRVATGRIANAMTGTYAEPEMYDAFDCPVCGCQMVAKKRLKEIEISGRTGEREIMTEKEKNIVARLNHPIYTVDFLDKWINRNDNVFINAPAALQAMGAKGYYEAVKQMAVAPRVALPKTVVLNHFSKPAENEKDTVEVGEYVYARDSATEYGFTKNHLYEILDTNGFDTVLMMNDKQEMINMSVEYFSSYSTLN